MPMYDPAEVKGLVRFPGPGKIQRDNQDPVQVRYPLLPEDAGTGVYPRVVSRPIYARFLLNRMGGPMDLTPSNVNTPWPGPSGRGTQTWLAAKPPRVNQYEKWGLSTQQAPGPYDLLAMQTYQTTWTSVRAKLSEILQSLNGG